MHLPSALLLSLPLVAVGQDYGGSSQSTSSAAPVAASSAPGVHVVHVGQGGFVFAPNTLTASAGDQVEFHFDEPTHSVAQGDFNNPCQPSNGSAFWSGFPDDRSQPFTVTINDTSPIWFYCAQVDHCQSGMVGVINPPSGQTINDFVTAAGKAPNSNAPAQIQGGVFAAAKGTVSTSSSAAVSSPSSNDGSKGLAASMAILGSGLLLFTLVIG